MFFQFLLLFPTYFYPVIVNVVLNYYITLFLLKFGCNNPVFHMILILLFTIFYYWNTYIIIINDKVKLGHLSIMPLISLLHQSWKIFR